MTDSNRRGRRAGLWIVGCVLLLAGGALWLGLTTAGRDGSEAPGTGGGTQMEEEDSAPSGSADSSAEPSDGGSSGEPAESPPVVGFDPQGTRPTTAPPKTPAPTDGAGSELEPAEPAAVVEAPGSILVSLVKVESVSGEATAGGEISGPALRITVSIRNNGEDALDLEYIVVNTYWGEERVPAGSVMQPGGAPFRGSLAPGEDAEGVYLFSVAEADREDVAITVDHQVGEPIVVFRGDLS
ncbi:MAG TPA: hypothetical protein K8U89_00165 [Brachybacterium faecium]|nr:hypothetical protein [Brachybacterium faecium]